MYGQVTTLSPLHHTIQDKPETKWFSDLNMRNSHSSETLAWLCAGLGITYNFLMHRFTLLTGEAEKLDRDTPGEWTGLWTYFHLFLPF